MELEVDSEEETEIDKEGGNGSKHSDRYESKQRRKRKWK
jgi:hypothetical protein